MMTTQTETLSPINTMPDLDDFFEIPATQRPEILLRAIYETHAWHYARNRAYRRAVEAKGVGEPITENHLSRILRPTAHVFKSYIDLLPTPFPENHPREFLQWLGENLSIEILPGRIQKFKTRYPNLEAFLQAIERHFNDLGFVIGTSSGTSGKSTIMVRDAQGVAQAIEAYKLAVYRLWGTKDAHEIIFIMPQQTRIVMAWLARLATQHLGMGPQAHFGIPFPASPDHVRIRSGQLFKPGLRGLMEKRLLYPFMNRMIPSSFVASIMWISGMTVSLDGGEKSGQRN